MSVLLLLGVWDWLCVPFAMALPVAATTSVTAATTSASQSTSITGRIYVGPSEVPTDAELATYETQWIDPVSTPANLTTFHLYEQPARGSNLLGSYLIYLPPEYNFSTASFPVMYWLHGGYGYSDECAWGVSNYHAAMLVGEMPQTIIVCPQALPIGYYVNSFDGVRPIEDVMIQDLITHIDLTYRTLTDRASRGIEGMSMGGYGTLHLAFKYPMLFGAISAIAPSILPNLTDEPWQRTADTFNYSTEYWEANAPWTLAEENAQYLRENTYIRIAEGSNDTRLNKAINSFGATLTALGIPYDSWVTEGAEHDYEEIVSGMGALAWSFWEHAFPPTPRIRHYCE
ncbi:MAG: hypothetical protein M1834_008017 [Cirrosporium novae-zelandiae]|nr:MAG: hypothetical protein M1834_008017 [Cirrosporium novae-zelandiae]